MRTRIFLFPVLLVCVACGRDDPQVAQLAEEVSTLAATATELESANAVLNDKIVELEREMETLGKGLRAPRAEATLDCEHPTRYNRVDSNSGIFLVRCRNAQEYLDGYKLLIDLGNPTTILYRGATVTMKWANGAKTREYPIYSDLLAGSWNSTEIIIAPAVAGELESLTVSVRTDQMNFPR